MSLTHCCSGVDLSIPIDYICSTRCVTHSLYLCNKAKIADAGETPVAVSFRHP